MALANLQEKSKWKSLLKNIDTWELRFRKIKPYDAGNKIKIFETDPFDIQRLFYRNKKGEQLVVLIPPTAKKKIVDELRKFNITEDFIYPDMDTVANEINEQINHF